MKKIIYLGLILATSQTAIALECPSGDEVLNSAQKQAKQSVNGIVRRMIVQGAVWTCNPSFKTSGISSITQVNKTSKTSDELDWRVHYETCDYKVRIDDNIYDLRLTS